MIDERFSLKAFDACGLDTPEAKSLAKLLADEVLQELSAAVSPKLTEIVGRLNEMGHSLKLYEPGTPGDFAYRDDYQDDTDYRCKLRLACDIIISSGYAHLWTPPKDDSDG